jgi:transcriptional regulator with XRE-family HTH domain
VTGYVSKIGHVTATHLTQDELESLRKRASLDLIAARVKRARKATGLSHDSICALMNEGRDDDEKTQRQTLMRWERAERRPALELLTLYAEATHRQVEWFLDPELDPSPFQEAAA